MAAAGPSRALWQNSARLDCTFGRWLPWHCDQPGHLSNPRAAIWPKNKAGQTMKMATFTQLRRTKPCKISNKHSNRPTPTIATAAIGLRSNAFSGTEIQANQDPVPHKSASAPRGIHGIFFIVMPLCLLRVQDRSPGLLAGDAATRVMDNGGGVGRYVGCVHCIYVRFPTSLLKSRPARIHPKSRVRRGAEPTDIEHGQPA